MVDAEHQKVKWDVTTQLYFSFKNFVGSNSNGQSMKISYVACLGTSSFEMSIANCRAGDEIPVSAQGFLDVMFFEVCFFKVVYFFATI